MSYSIAINKLLLEDGVKESTMMKNPCLRYKEHFLTMMFEREDAIIIKVSSNRVEEIIAQGKGREFSFTKKTFKEWVLIPLDYEDEYESYLYEALNHIRAKD